MLRVGKLRCFTGFADKSGTKQQKTPVILWSDLITYDRKETQRCCSGVYMGNLSEQAAEIAYGKRKVLSLKDRNTMKSIVLAIAATLLCLVLISLSWDLFVKTVSFMIDKTSVVDYRVRILAVILKPERTSFVISGLLTGVFIGFVSKNNRLLTTTVTLVLIAMVFVLSWLGSFYWFGKESMPIRIGLSCIRLALVGGCILLSVWIMSRWTRKAGRQSLPGDNLTASPLANLSSYTAMSKKLKVILSFGFLGYLLTALFVVAVFYPDGRKTFEGLVPPSLFFLLIVMGLLLFKDNKKSRETETDIDYWRLYKKIAWWFSLCLSFPLILSILLFIVVTPVAAILKERPWPPTEVWFAVPIFIFFCMVLFAIPWIIYYLARLVSRYSNNRQRHNPSSPHQATSHRLL